jgi:hypothetical protein
MQPLLPNPADMTQPPATWHSSQGHMHSMVLTEVPSSLSLGTVHGGALTCMYSSNGVCWARSSPVSLSCFMERSMARLMRALRSRMT